MRALLIAALLLARVDYAVQQSHPQPIKKQQEVTHNLPPSISAQPHPTAKTQQKEAGREPVESLWSRAFEPTTWPSWFVAIAGVVGIVVAVWTLRAIRVQTNATKSAAEAALLTAQSMINSERAWIKVVMLNAGRIHYLKVVNVGRTPARIVGYDYAFCAPPHLDFEGADSCILGKTEKKYGAFVAPRRKLDLEEFRTYEGLVKEREQEMSERKISIVLKGQVRYRDVVNDTEDHVTVFLFYLDSGDWKFHKPADPKYNVHT